MTDPKYTMVNELVAAARKAGAEKMRVDILVGIGKCKQKQKDDRDDAAAKLIVAEQKVCESIARIEFHSLYPNQVYHGPTCTAFSCTETPIIDGKCKGHGNG
jgi:hypothetical protein